MFWQNLTGQRYVSSSRQNVLSPDDELSSASAGIIRPDVNVNARENRFQNGHHKYSGQILSCQVLAIENLTLANPASYVSLLPLPYLKEEPEILVYSLQKGLCTFKVKIPRCKVLRVYVRV